MKTFAIPANRLIRLPKRLFKPADRVVVLEEGDAVTIKKLEPARLSSIAARIKDRPLPLREILKEVQAHRYVQRTR